MRRVLTGLDKQVVNQTSIGMQTLNLGGRSQTGNNIVDMYKSAYFSGANINFRSYVAFQMEMRSYASIINELWYASTCVIQDTTKYEQENRRRIRCRERSRQWGLR
jgi:hypothetical protein